MDLQPSFINFLHVLVSEREGGVSGCEVGLGLMKNLGAEHEPKQRSCCTCACCFRYFLLVLAITVAVGGVIAAFVIKELDLDLDVLRRRR